MLSAEVIKIQTGAFKNLASVKSRFCAAHKIYEISANVIPLEKFQNAITGVCITIGTMLTKKVFFVGTEEVEKLPERVRNL
jgi:hypothetical protein